MADLTAKQRARMADLSLLLNVILVTNAQRYDESKYRLVDVPIWLDRVWVARHKDQLRQLLGLCCFFCFF